MAKGVALPTYMLIEWGAINRLRQTDIYAWLEDRKVVLISGTGHTRLISKRLQTEMNGQKTQMKSFACANNSMRTIDELVSRIQKNETEVIMAIGGGKVLDVAKMAGTRTNIPVILIPTAISSDAICSPIAVIRMNEATNVSIGVQMPKAVIIDLEIITASPPRLLVAGIGDLLSNKTAIVDWKLAEQAKQDQVNTLASIMATQAVEAFLHSVNRRTTKREALLQTAAHSLISSGIAMAIAGSSRPCSGSEHLISHALDHYCGGKALHGEQVAIGILLAEYLQGQHTTDDNLRQYFQYLGLPLHYKELGYTEEELSYAIRMAPTIRERYTVLNEYPLTDRQIDHLLKEVFGSQ